MPTRILLKLIALSLLVLVFAGQSKPVNGHAFLESSDPVAGAILPVAPDEVRLSFSERLEPDATSARLYDNLGVEIPGTSYRIQNEKVLVVTLPPDLENGTYSVVFSNISRDDGHPARGYLPFTIGSAADLRAITALPALEGPAGAPEWLRIGSRWLAFTGLLLALAVWPIWALVIAPSLRRTPGEMRTTLTAARRFAYAAIGLALFGNLAALLSQALERDDPIVDALTSTLFDTRFGELWQFRLLLLGLLATLLAVVNWIRPNRRRWASLAALVASCALAIPFSLNSHAAAQVSGRAFAITADLLHLISAGLWGGGAVLITVVLSSIRRRHGGESMRELLPVLIPRFSFVAIAAWIVLIVSGAYAAWLQIGNLDAARATTYGNAFLIKLGIAATLLAFGATQFVIVSRRLSQTVWARRLELILFAETIGIVAILLVTGWLTSAPPARDALAQDAAGITIELTQNDIPARLLITPASAGPNHYQLTFTGNAPPESDAVLRLTPPDGLFDQIELALTPVGTNVWEAHGSEFSLAGDWQIEAIVRKIGEFQWQASGSAGIGSDTQALPGQPWRFSWNAFAGLTMLVIGAIALARAVTFSKGRSRKETLGIGLAGLAIGAAFLVTARLEPPPSFALADDATIARGSALYAQQCLACHGVTGEGNGPQAASLPVPPADFTDPIHQLHSDSSLAAMIENGFPLSGMPAFVDILGAGEIADVVAYLRSLGAGASTIDTPSAADCKIPPRDIGTLISITTGEAASETDVSSWPPGPPALSSESDAAAATIRQFIACSNAGDYPRVLATSTLRSLVPQFAALDDPGRDQALAYAGEIRPLTDGEQLAIESIDPARSLPDGRVATRVVTLDPINHPHRLEVILILAQEDGIWRIDEIHTLDEPARDQPESASTWPLVVRAGEYSIAFTLGEPGELGRSLRIRLEDASGASVDGATGSVMLVPRGVGMPLEVDMANVDPGVYFAWAPALGPGSYVAEVTMILPDGSELTTGFTFVL